MVNHDVKLFLSSSQAFLPGSLAFEPTPSFCKNAKLGLGSSSTSQARNPALDHCVSKADDTCFTEATECRENWTKPDVECEKWIKLMTHT